MHITRPHLHKAAFGLALFVGAALAAPAHAQTLTLGQSGSTTLSGTATLTDTGTTAGGAYTYNDAGTGTALANQNSYDDWDAYGPSTANVARGVIGKTYVNGLTTHDTSTGNVSGGTIFDLYADDSSTTNVTGGRIRFLEAFNTATANVSGGYIGGNFNLSGGFYTNDSSTANVSGGTTYILDVSDTSTATVTGGTISYLNSGQSATVNVGGGTVSNLGMTGGTDNLSGGTISDFISYGGTANVSGGAFGSLETATLPPVIGMSTGTANISGGTFGSLITEGAGVLDLFGTGLTATEQNEPASAGFRGFALTGTLLNGDPLDAIYKDYGGTGMLELNGRLAIPEASTLVSTGLLIFLGLCGLMACARRKAKTGR